MNFKVGMRVSFLNEVGEGIILKITDDETVEVETDDGFPRNFHVAELIEAPDQEEMRKAYHLGTDRNLEPHEREAIRKLKEVQGDSFNARPAKLQNARKTQIEMEVDLHIHELVENERFMSPGEMIAVQMKHFERMLEIALKERKKRMVVIHGVGEGVLRNEIRSFLQDVYPQIEFLDASYVDYGHGATELILRQG